MTFQSIEGIVLCLGCVILGPLQWKARFPWDDDVVHHVIVNYSLTQMDFVFPGVLVAGYRWRSSLQLEWKCSGFYQRRVCSIFCCPAGFFFTGRSFHVALLSSAVHFFCSSAAVIYSLLIISGELCCGFNDAIVALVGVMLMLLSMKLSYDLLYFCKL